MNRHPPADCDFDVAIDAFGCCPGIVIALSCSAGEGDSYQQKLVDSCRVGVEKEKIE